jgi:hypothetical protein
VGPILVLVTAAAVVLVVATWIVVARSRQRRAVDRGASRNGSSAVKARTTFIVHGIPAADVMRELVVILGYPELRSGRPAGMFIVSATDTEALFALGEPSGEAWASNLVIRDRPDGAHGQYEVTRWLVDDGIPAGWKDMEIVARRISEIVMSIGGTVKVTLAE